MLPTRQMYCGSLFLSGFLVWKSSIHRKGNGISAKHNGGLYAADECSESPFRIYRDALDCVMSSLSLDENAATEVILSELGYSANNGLVFGVQSAAEEIKKSCLTQGAVDWERA